MEVDHTAPTGLLEGLHPVNLGEMKYSLQPSQFFGRADIERRSGTSRADGQFTESIHTSPTLTHSD